MHKRDFPIHGDIQLSVNDGLLIIEGSGPANLEAVLCYQREAQRYRDKLNPHPWGSLVLLRGEPLLPPEAKSLLVTTIQFACTQSLVATAVVFMDVKHASTVRFFWDSVYAETELLHAFFENENDARAWLHKQIDLAS